MTEENIPSTSLDDYDNEGEGSNQAKFSTKPSNKRSKRNSGNNPKKTKILEKSDKYKSWVWKWCDPIEFENGTVGGECRVKLTDEKICGKTYLSGNSTSNLITHLAGAHQITEDTNIEGRLVSLILF